MFTAQDLRKKPSLVKAFLGLTAAVFEQLIADVQARLPEYERQRLERADRQRAVGGGRKCDQPLVIRVALVLTYLRLHISQEAVALLYGATQSDVSRELRRLLPVIREVLPCPEVWEVVEEGLPLEGAAEPVAEGAAEPVAEGAAEPAVEGAAEPAVEGAAEPVVEGAAEPVAEGTAEPVAEGAAEPVAEGAAEPVAEGAAEPAAEGTAEPVVEGAAEPAVEGAAEPWRADLVLVDATEQQVYRSQDGVERKEHYSGKKKQFTLKTQFVTDGEHHIKAISVAVGGATHDKTLSDEVNTLERLPEGTEVNADKGYQGLDKQVGWVTVRHLETGEEQQVPRLTVRTPVKKPKGGELTEAQQAFNQHLSRLRVRVEHCLGWVKNWDVIATRFRCDHGIYTLIMQVVCGLVNHQTHRWQAARATVEA
jgi:hypothetical protein